MRKKVSDGALQVIISRRFRLIQDLLNLQSPNAIGNLPREYVADTVAQHRRADRGQDRDLGLSDIRVLWEYQLL